MSNTTNQENSFNSFYSPKLNLDLDNSSFSGDKPMLKNLLNGNIEGWNSQGFFITQEYSNKLCFEYPPGYKLAGKIKLNNDEFALCFETPTSSELGLFSSSTCTYTKWCNDPCLNFKEDNWITGVYKFNQICNSRSVYIVDGVNPDRVIDIDNPYPKKQIGTSVDSCATPVYGTQLDCTSLLSNTFIKFPNISLDSIPGNLPNGKYRVAFGFSDNGFVISDYFISQELVLFDENNTNGLSIKLDIPDTEHTHFNLVLLQDTLNGSNSYLIGSYGINNNNISILNTANYSVISKEEVFSINSKYLTSSHITTVNNQLVKAGLSEHKYFNYQPLANNIASNFVVNRVKAINAYKFSQYLRDEIYAFFIEWIYKDGYISQKFTIPNNTKSVNKSIVEGDDVFEKGGIEYYKAFNSARITEDLSTNFRCGNESTVVYKGDFGYFQSTDKYPDSSYSYKNKEYKVFDKLACEYIKLHKFPDNSLVPHFYKCPECIGEEYIDVLGIEFSNINRPVDLDGNIIDDIIGYRIVRADRTNNQTIISKGLFSNMLYEEKEDIYFPNFPYNDLNPNKFLSSAKVENPVFKQETNYKPLSKYSNSKFTYYSPETSYTTPVKGSSICLYGEHIGCVETNIEEVYKHPKFKLLTDFSYLLSGLIGTTVGALNFKGTTTKTTTEGKDTRYLSGSTFNGASSTGGLMISMNNEPVNTGLNAYVAEPISVVFEEDGNITVYLDKPVTGGGGQITWVPTAAVYIVDGSGISLRGVAPAGVGLARPKGIFKLPDNRLVVTVTGAPVINTGLNLSGSQSSTTTTSSTSVDSGFGGAGVINQTLNVVNKVMASITYAMEGMHTTLNLVKSFNKFQQYAFQVNSVSRSSSIIKGNVRKDNQRRQISNFGFLQRSNEYIGTTKINNLNRNQSVFLELNKDLKEPSKVDNSRVLSSEINCDLKAGCCNNISVNYYGSIKNNNFNPYGGFNNILTIPIQDWTYLVNNNPTSTNLLYNGDTYITKFTLKTHFPLFLNIPVGEENGFEIDYDKYPNIAKPRFWADSTDIEAYELIQFDIKQRSKSLANLDCFSKFSLSDLDPTNLNLKDVFVKSGKFYLSVNGVYDFYVESSYINDYRIKSSIKEEIHFPKQDFNLINRADRHIYDNKFLYDQSLRSNTFYPQSSIFTKYTPETCNKSEFKLIYSNYSNNLDKYDNWKIFKPLSFTQLNKHDGSLTSINSFDNNRLMLFFEDRTYITAQDETLLTKSGENIFVGSGDIFSRKLQPISLDDTGYAGCTDKYSILNTKHGITWVDRKRKKIYNYSNNLDERSLEGITQWLQVHLETNKVTTHRESIKTIYDNHYDKIYYTNDTQNECSWTLSYKPGLGWLSFHSFIPLEYFSLSNNFLSSNKIGIWKHNEYNESYQTYYGERYPYSFSYVLTSKGPAIFQSVEIKNEVTTENNFINQIYHNNLFFNKFNMYTDYGNTGLLEVIVKEKENRYIEINQTNTNSLEYNGKCVTTPIEGNYWRLNKYRNFAISQPHTALDCNGYNTSYLNIDPDLDPKLSGNMRGNWAVLTLTNDLVYDKRFKTYFSINTTSNIKR